MKLIFCLLEVPFFLYTKELFFRVGYVALGFFFVLVVLASYSKSIVFYFVCYLAIFLPTLALELVTFEVTEIFRIEMFVGFLVSLYVYACFFFLSLFSFFVEGFFCSSRSRLLILIFFLLICVSSFFFFRGSIVLSFLDFFFSYHIDSLSFISYLSFSRLVQVFVCFDFLVFLFLFMLFVIAIIRVYRLYYWLRNVLFFFFFVSLGVNFFFDLSSFVYFQLVVLCIFELSFFSNLFWKVWEDSSIG